MNTDHHMARMSDDSPRGFGVRGDVRKRLATPDGTVETVLLEHVIECTGIGEVTCRGCRSAGWMTWTAFRKHVGDAIRAHVAAGGVL